MFKKVGIGILRTFSLLGCATIVIIFVVTAGSAFMPGTKIGHLFGASSEALAGQNDGNGGKTVTAREFAASALADLPDAGVAPDAGTLAARPAGQGSAAPVEAQPLPEQQAR